MVLLTVAELQIFTDCVMDVVDLLTAETGLQFDFNTDIVNGHSLQAEADEFSIAGILFVKVSQKLDLQFLFSRFRTEFVQHLILNRWLTGIFDIKSLTIIFVVNGKNLHAFRVVAFQKTFV